MSADQHLLPGLATKNAGRIVCFIGLNPSDAGGPKAGKDGNDPTMRREIGFARSWGYDGGREDGAVFSPEGRYRYVLFRRGLAKVNLFALVSPDPKVLRTDPDPAGPDNDFHLTNWITQSDLVVCVWGANPAAKRRAPDVLRMIRALGKVPHAIRVTEKCGAPEHSLYLPGHLTPVEYRRCL